jgi:hypothetical protein
MRGRKRESALEAIRQIRHAADFAGIQVGRLADVPTFLPLCTDVFRVCDRGGGTLRRGAWGMDGDSPRVAVPSVCKRRLRSGDAIGDGSTIRGGASHAVRTKNLIRKPNFA